jgi:replication factor C subunit 2/4
MRVLEGVGTLVQLGGLVSRLCRFNLKPDLLKL